MSKIYLSSTYEDLKDYREAAGRGLRRLLHQVIGMEDYVASDERPLDRCLKDVAESDIYVGLFAHRYGFIPPDGNPGGHSITELEFREALRRERPTLIFLLHPDQEWKLTFTDAVTGEGERGAKIMELRKEFTDKKLASFFKTPSQLESLVTAAVALHTQQTLVAPPAPPPAPEPRQVAFDLFLAHGDTDRELADSLVANLASEPGFCFVQRSSPSLFARTERDFSVLDAAISQCAVASVLLSETALNRMDESRRRVQLIIETMRERTDVVLALATSAECIRRAGSWNFSGVLDISAFAGDQAAATRRLKSELKSFGSALRPPAIGLPWVVAAMTEEEAGEIASDLRLVERHFGESMRLQFETVCAALGKPFLKRYRARRDGWLPPGSESTIAELSADSVAVLASARNPKLRGRAIRLQHYPFDAIVEDHPELRIVYRDIAEQGCAMIVDELSLFHPRVHDALQRAHMARSRHTAIVSVSPFEHYGLPAHEAVRKELRQRLAGAFDRFTLDYDPQCELSVGDECRLRRWLYHSLPETVETLRNPPPNRDIIRQFADEEKLDPDASGGALFSRGGVL